MAFEAKNYDRHDGGVDGGCAVVEAGVDSVDGSSSSVAGSNLDRVLFNDLCEMVPLVKILMDNKVESSFTRRGSMIYTKMPSNELPCKKLSESKGRNVSHSIPPKKKGDAGDRDNGKDGSGHSHEADGFSMFSSKILAAETEDLVQLREQVEDLQRKLSEKEESLKSAEVTKGEISSVHAQNEELRHEAAEKDSIIMSIQLQLSDAMMKLADKQAALEKTQWEAMTSMKKAEKLQEALVTIQSEVSLATSIFQDLTSNGSLQCSRDYDVVPYYTGDLTSADDFGSGHEQEMEDARRTYIDAVATAKEKQDEESMAFATQARLQLQSFIF